MLNGDTRTESKAVGAGAGGGARYVAWLMKYHRLLYARCFIVRLFCVTFFESYSFTPIIFHQIDLRMLYPYHRKPNDST